MSIVTAWAPTSAKASAWAAAMGRVNHYIKNGSVGDSHVSNQNEFAHRSWSSPRDTHRSRQQQDGLGLTGSRQMLHDGNSEALQFGLIADTRLHENLGRVNRYEVTESSRRPARFERMLNDVDHLLL